MPSIFELHAFNFDALPFSAGVDARSPFPGGWLFAALALRNSPLLSR